MNNSFTSRSIIDTSFCNSATINQRRLKIIYLVVPSDLVSNSFVKSLRGILFEGVAEICRLYKEIIL